MSTTAGYDLIEQAPLDSRNTLRVCARAPWLLRVRDASLLPEALALPPLAGMPLLTLGSGSNVLFAADPEAVVLCLETDRIAILDTAGAEDEDGHSALVYADAGVQWHALVLWSLRQGLHGLENLALIPGTVGAAPIQNIGAYGVELAEFVHRVHAIDLDRGTPTVLSARDCAFAYRDSVFKHHPDRYLVTGVEFRLPVSPRLRLDYAGLREALSAAGAPDGTPTSMDVAEAVIRIRQRKLPDPALVGNAGSFFKNPVVAAALAATLRDSYPGLPVFEAGSHDDNRKLSAAWMIEHCGWKGFREGDAGIADTHALVLVNHGHASGAQLLDLAHRVADSVQLRFGVALEPEPRIIGAAWPT